MIGYYATKNRANCDEIELLAKKVDSWLLKDWLKQDKTIQILDGISLRFRMASCEYLCLLTN